MSGQPGNWCSAATHEQYAAWLLLQTFLRGQSMGCMCCLVVADKFCMTFLPCAVGKKLDQKVEQSIQASGVLLLTLVAVVLVVRDTINLGSGKPFM